MAAVGGGLIAAEVISRGAALVAAARSLSRGGCVPAATA
jgi:hypothetical protein